MAKVLFVYPNLTGQQAISLGIASLSAFVKQKGHHASLVDYTFGGSFKDCLNKIRSFKPDVVAFSLRSGEYRFCLELADKIKKKFDLFILFGGVHPTVQPDEVINNTQVDMICVGEGEEALSELLDSIDKKKDFSKIQNLWVKKEGKVIKNSCRPLIEDLDKLPYVDRDIYDYSRYLESGKVDIIVGRGCPFSCSYCINSFNKKNFKGKYVRLRSPEKVIDEIKKLKEKYNFKWIYFQDDVFTTKSWLKDFHKIYIKKIGLPFICYGRVETIDDNVCSYLQRSGCSSIQIGIETGNEKLRWNVLKRYMTNGKIIKAFKCLKRYGIKTYSLNMVGIPFETEKDYWDTIRLNRIVKPDYMQASIFQPYPGTEIYQVCIGKGFLKEKYLPMGHSYYCVLDYPGTSRKEIERRRRYFRFRVLRVYNLKKALFVLFFDYFFIYFWKVRAKLPSSFNRLFHKLKLVLRK